jgi:tRNA-dihydrouridine synthase 3
VTTPSIDWTGKRILAPLTKGGNLPFRRLCVELGAEITLSEMAYSRQVVRRSRAELALLRRHPSETCFGVQLAVSKPDDGVRAGLEAVERGAAFVDINAGCPIHDVVRRGMGATLLRRPAALARIVEQMVAALPVPVTVKIRAGWCEGEVNAPEIARLLEEAGCAAITLHARTREQRYHQAADWTLVRQLVAERTIPIIGNGDVLTHYEERARREESGCAAVMLARGALIKPWLFREIAERTTWQPTVEERLQLLLRFVGYLREHFGDDELGRTRAMRFLPWHLDFFARFRPLPEAEFGARSREHPLMQTRLEALTDPSPVERLLADARTDVHARIADLLWDAADADAARARLEELAVDSPAGELSYHEVATAHG